MGSNCATEAAALGIDTATPRKIESDSIWSYEVGSKNKLFGGHLALDAAAYRQKWTNIQSNVLLPQCQVLTTLNLGDAQIDGFDVSLMAIPVRGLSLGASVSRTNARYTSELAIGPYVVHSKGEPLDVAPWMFHLSGEYEATVGNREIYVRADDAQSTHNSRPLDDASFLTDPNIPRAPATSSLDLRAGTRFNGFDISLFANNVLDAHPLLSIGHDNAVPPSGFYRSTTFRPRTIGITVSMRR